jgi:hypothetical protein
MGRVEILPDSYELLDLASGLRTLASSGSSQSSQKSSLFQAVQASWANIDRF